MPVKQITALIFAYSIQTFLLFGQPYGYSYDPYNFPARRPARIYNAPYYNPPINPYYQGRQIRPAIPPYPPMDYSSNGFNTGSSLDPQSPEYKIEEIIHFWFGKLSHPNEFPANQISLWEGSVQGDRLIKERFLNDYNQAVLGHYNSWRETPEGRLALIILLDQFPRHIYTDQAQMFASDKMALGLAAEGIQTGADQQLYPIEKAFFYMPFQHAENLEMQAISVDLYHKLVLQSPLPIRPIMQEFLRLAIKHQEVIKRFGRFPHRNKILGRVSSPEERVYLGHKSAFRY